MPNTEKTVADIMEKAVADAAKVACLAAALRVTGIHFIAEAGRMGPCTVEAMRRELETYVSSPDVRASRPDRQAWMLSEAVGRISAACVAESGCGFGPMTAVALNREFRSLLDFFGTGTVPVRS